jgi:hypothetical protein
MLALEIEMLARQRTDHARSARGEIGDMDYDK